MIKIYDGVVEDHVAQLIDSEMRKVQWKFDYPSNRMHPSRHWHVFCAGEKHSLPLHDNNYVSDLIKNGYEWVLPIWTSAMLKYDFKNTYNVDTFKRIYMNAHTHGIEPVMHKDDGDFTMLYYPRMDWKIEWGGGTSIYDMDIETDIQRHVPYIGNRLLTFRADFPHQAMPVARECYELRSVIVFKCDVNNI